MDRRKRSGTLSVRVKIALICFKIEAARWRSNVTDGWIVFTEYLKHEDTWTQRSIHTEDQTIATYLSWAADSVNVQMFTSTTNPPTENPALLKGRLALPAVRVLGRLLWSDSDSWAVAIALRICFRLVKHRKDEKLEMLQNHPSRNLSAKSKSLNLWLSCEWGKWTVRGPRSTEVSLGAP